MTLDLWRLGAEEPERIAFDGELTLGREETGAGSLAADDLVSRQHARLNRLPDGGLEVEDLGSTNGTFVNEARLDDGPVTLREGDVVRVGRTTFEARPAPAVATEVVPEAAAPASTQVEAPVELTREDVRPVEQVGSPSSIVPVAQLFAALPTGAFLLRGQDRLAVPSGGLSIGRAPDNGLVLESDLVSRYHARLATADGRWYLADLGSLNGTSLNGERLVSASRWLNAGDNIVVGGETLRFLAGDGALPGTAHAGPRRHLFTERLTIGRDPSNQLVFDAPNLSGFHAEVVRVDGRIELHDLDSRNGTRLDGQPVSSGVIVPGSEIGIGPFRLVFDGESFVERDDRGAIRLEAHEVSVAARDRLILDRSSLTIQPGEFAALIGESGAGKSTLMKVLAGVRRPTSGSVLVNGEPIWARLTDVGYLPQDEIVHPRLSVLESLTFSARLRLPLDASEGEIAAAVERVVDEVSLGEHINTRIGSLSGGQRKRVGLATELLNRPGLLFLDEPTTGLDPGLEARMMELFRDLAAVGTSGVLVATHATRSLGLVDTLCVVGRGGHLCFVGPPEDARTFFGVSSYDEIYAALEDRPAEQWRRDFEAGRSTPQLPPQPSSPARVAASTEETKELVKAQGHVLLDRYVKVFTRDKRNLLILLVQAPVLAVAMALLFKPNVFDPPGIGLPSSAAQLIFVLVTTVIWLGTIDAAREIIKERAIFERERAVGVDPRSYLLSKLVLLAGVAALQTVLMVLVVDWLRPFHESFGTELFLVIELMLTALVAVAMGLAISAVVRTEDQATAFIPIAMVAQLLFGGAIVTVKNMGTAIAALSTLIFERWSYAGAGRILHMNARIARDSVMSSNNAYGTKFFGHSPIVTFAILLVFLAAFTGATLKLLRRPDRS